MEASISSALMESDFEETKILKALIDAFSSTFSLREIASAYCKAGRNPDLAAQILYDGQNLNNDAATSSESSLCDSVANNPNPCSTDHKGSKESKPRKLAFSGVIGKGCEMCNTPTYGPMSCIWPSLSETLGESVAQKPNWGAFSETLRESVAQKPNWGALSETLRDSVANNPNSVPDQNSMASQPKKTANAGGSVSGYAMRNRPAYGPVSATQPLKVDSKDFLIDELIDDDVTSDSTAKEDQMHTDPSVAGKVLGRMVEGNKAVPRGAHNNPFNQKGLNKSNGNNGHFWKRKIFVGGLSPSLIKEEFKAYFEKFGRTTDVVIVYDSTTHQPKGFGFITFDSMEAVENATKKRFHELNGKVVEVKRFVLACGPVSATKPLEVDIKDFPIAELIDDDVTSDSTVKEDQMHTGTEDFNKINGGNNGQVRTKKIFVGGFLSPSLTEEEFRAYFEKFGRITDVVFKYNSTTHRPRGFGFITFDSEETVENITQKRFHELKGKKVEVKRMPEDGSDNGHSGGCNMRMKGGRGGSRFGDVQSGGFNPPLRPGYGGTPTVSPRSPL